MWMIMLFATFPRWRTSILNTQKSSRAIFLQRLPVMMAKWEFVNSYSTKASSDINSVSISRQAKEEK